MTHRDAGRRLTRDADGLAAVEFALIAPVLVLFMAGVASFGLGLRLRMEVGAAARAGAAYASSHGFDPSKIAAAAQAATVLATNVSVASSQSTQSCANPSNGTVASAGGASTCPGTGVAPGTYVTVTTQMPYTFLMPIPGLGDNTTLHGAAVSRVQ